MYLRAYILQFILSPLALCALTVPVLAFDVVAEPASGTYIDHSQHFWAKDFDLSHWWEEARHKIDQAHEWMDTRTRKILDENRISLSGFKTDIKAVVEKLEEYKEEVFPDGIDLDHLGEELAPSLESIVAYLQVTFPSPDKSPSHAERVKMVDDTLQKVGESLVRASVDRFGADETTARVKWHDIHWALRKFLITTGDVIEQHPQLTQFLVETLIISAAVIIVPEVLLARRILGLFGFSPIGPFKGSPAAWLQRRFWGAAVARGSWFAALQSAAMKPVPPALGFIGGLLGAIGVLFSLGSCFGSRN